MRLKQILFLWMFVSVSILLIQQTSFAQVPIINAVPLPVGSGARALGMGGAFTAVADDATAASWNPGGLTQLERPELSAVGSFLTIHQDWDPGDTGFSFNDESVSRGDLNFASVAYPFKIFEKNFVAALNYHKTFDFSSKLKIKSSFEESAISLKQKFDFQSEGGIAALTPALSMQVIPKLSIGVAVNYHTNEYFGNFARKDSIKSAWNGTLMGIPYGSIYNADTTFKNFQAVNVTTGMLLDVWEKEDKKLTFGAVYNSPYTAGLDKITNSVSIKNTPPVSIDTTHSREHYKIDYPMSFGAGLCFRYSDALLFSMDMMWTDWSVFKQKNTETGERSRPLGGASADAKMTDTYAVRAGAEYLIFKQKVIVPIRGGLFYDPRPSLGSPTDVYGFSVGSGITFKRFSIDGAYQFRWTPAGKGEDYGLPGTQFDSHEHLLLASVIVYF